jgi:hypothetical protein
VEAVHIELADERGEIVVLEMRSKNGTTEFTDIGDDEGGAEVRPGDVLRRLGVCDHPEVKNCHQSLYSHGRKKKRREKRCQDILV